MSAVARCSPSTFESHGSLRAVAPAGSHGSRGSQASPRPHPWLAEAVASLDGLPQRCGPHTGRRIEAVLSRLRRMNGGSSLLEALQRPASTPFVALVDACAADLGLADDSRVVLVGRSTVYLYLYVRIQDDLVDEPDRTDRAAVYAAEVALGESLAALAAAAPDPRVFAARAALMGRFAEVAAREVDERDAGASDDDLAALGDKFLPMAVPLVALAILAGRPSWQEPLVEVVRRIGTALQLVNDLYNAPEDREDGRPTPLLRWLDADPSLAREAPLHAVLIGHPALDRSLAHARRSLEEAATLCEGLRAPALAAVVHATLARLPEVPERLLRLLLGASV